MSPITVAFKVSVVGISFADTYPDNVYALERMLYDGWRWTEDEPLTAILVREPDNEYDPNAIAVHVPALGEHAHLGHVPRNVAARLAPQLDAGEQWQAGISEIRVHPDHPTNPGVTLVCVPAKVSAS